jgi:hypothetical protein
MHTDLFPANIIYNDVSSGHNIFGETPRFLHFDYFQDCRFSHKPFLFYNISLPRWVLLILSPCRF